DDDSVAVHLAGLGLGEPDARDLGVGVDGTRDCRLAHRRLVPHRVLRRDPSLAEARVREWPVAGAVARGVDVRHVRPAVLVRTDSLAVERHPGGLETDALDEGSPAD